MSERRGKVYLVGAGPGSPDLITVRGAELLKSADVVVYDYLVSEDLLNLPQASAELIFVGKKGGGERAFDQDTVNQILIERARAGKRVLRLKGGDPFIFGRGGEESAALATAGIEFEYVPGVTSAVAAPAYAGIPLTHRQHGSFVAFVTGHEDEAKASPTAVPWEELGRAACHRGTLVLLMAVARLGEILDRLIKTGLSAETPAAAIQHASTAAQRTVIGTLATLADQVKRAGLAAPAVVVVGGCVTMREQLQWFERRPLFGRRIVVTRSRSNVGRLALELRELGAEVIEFPTIETVEPDDYGALDRAVAELAGFDWLIFTSGQAVQRFIGRLSKLGHDVRELAGASLAAIGPATAAALRNHGLSVATVPSEFRAEAIVDAIGPNNIKGAAFLIPRAQVARETIIELLILNGARRVEAVAVYKTVKPSAARVGRIRQLLANDAVDIVVFTSSSTVTNFCSLVGSLPGEQKAAAIGTVTADTARKHGFDVVVTPVEYTIDGLITATCGYFGSRQ